MSHAPQETSSLKEMELQLEAKAQELDHAERMRQIELGQVLPDVSKTRMHVVGTIATLVPIALAAGAATASVALVRTPVDHGASMFGMAVTGDPRAVILATIWGIAGLSTLLTVVLCLRKLEVSPECSKKQG